jgi:hypothetical protein
MHLNFCPAISKLSKETTYEARHTYHSKSQTIKIQELSVITFHCHQVTYKNSNPKDTVHQLIGHHA